MQPIYPKLQMQSMKPGHANPPQQPSPRMIWGLMLTVFLVVFALVWQQAQAQSLVYPKVTETYVGANFVQDFENKLDPHVNGGNFEARNSDQARNLMVRWGYREERTYGIELGYMFMPSWSAKSNNGSVLDYKANGFFADLFLFFPMTTQASLYFKIGTARLTNTSTLAVATNANGSSYTTKIKDTNWAPTAGVGLEYQLDPAFAIRGGWENIKTKSVDGQAANHNGFNIGGLLFYE